MIGVAGEVVGMHRRKTPNNGRYMRARVDESWPVRVGYQTGGPGLMPENVLEAVAI